MADAIIMTQGYQTIETAPTFSGWFVIYDIVTTLAATSRLSIISALKHAATAGIIRSAL
jgi:hypothetical protein